MSALRQRSWLVTILGLVWGCSSQPSNSSTPYGNAASGTTSGTTGTSTTGSPTTGGITSAGPSTATATTASTLTGTTTGAATSTTGTPLPVTYPRPCADLYEETLFPTFDVEMAASEWAGMLDDCQNMLQTYRPIRFSYAGEVVDAMMRLKGNWSWSCDKMQYVISFNEVNPDARFHGLRKIVLDAPWYDPTLIHERLAFHYLGQYGVPNSCVNHARLNINGAYYGVYSNVERLDREYLERHFEDPSGNLFEAGLELKTNEEVGTTVTVDAFWEATTVAELDALVDIPQAIGVWAGLAMLPDPDSYWAGVEINFYLYEHPTNGLLFLPYDTDISFAENIWPDLVEADPITYEHEEWLREEQYQVILSDPAWCAEFEAALGRARQAYVPAELEAKIDAWTAQIESSVQEDPHLPFTLAERQEALANMRTFAARRAAFVDQWLAEGSHCPVEWPGGGRGGG